MKDINIENMIPYKKYMFIRLVDDKTKFFTAYFDKYDGDGWIKIYEPCSLISKDKLNFCYITNFQAYELTETYHDMILRYLNIKRGSTINIDINTIISDTLYTAVFVSFYIGYRHYRDFSKDTKYISNILQRCLK